MGSSWRFMGWPHKAQLYPIFGIRLRQMKSWIQLPPCLGWRTCRSVGLHDSFPCARNGGWWDCWHRKHSVWYEILVSVFETPSFKQPLFMTSSLWWTHFVRVQILMYFCRRSRRNRLAIIWNVPASSSTSSHSFREVSLLEVPRRWSCRSVLFKTPRSLFWNLRWWVSHSIARGSWENINLSVNPTSCPLLG